MNDLITAEQSIKPTAVLAAAMRDTVEGFVVCDDRSLGELGDLVKELTQAKKRLDKERQAITKPINAGLRAVNTLFKAPTAACDDVIVLAKNKIAEYVQLQAIIASETKKREAAQQAEADRLQQAAALAEADDLANQGATETADAYVLATNTAIEHGHQETAPGPIYGAKATVSAVKTWQAEVVDKTAFFQALADGYLNPDLIDIRPGELRKYANQVGRDIGDGQTSEFGGVLVSQKISASIR
jgi:hypothetical protein|tara:strand:- start:152 stop:880 length:729 start_codon:yes stop_codon:yes gene_type:complete